MTAPSYLSAAICLLTLTAVSAQAVEYPTTSPDKRLTAVVYVDKGKGYYRVEVKGERVLEASRLGLVREDADLATKLSLVEVEAAEAVESRYELFTGKRRSCAYMANRRVFHLKNEQGQKLDLIFQVSNDGVAFQYQFPGQDAAVRKVREELTSFALGTEAKAWLQPMAEAKTGWSQTNPSYEEYYELGIAAGKPAPSRAGWVFPALFQTKEHWVLLTETFPEGNYCGSRLRAEAPKGEYRIGFADPREVVTGEIAGPASTLPWATPWRIIAVGSLKQVMESTLGTDLAKPSVVQDPHYIRPGYASWSWALLKDDSTIFPVQRAFIDYAGRMHWQYCLIDAEWDRKIGYEKMKELADHAASKGVGLWVWYNSAGAWNTAPQYPRDRLLTPETRRAEFARIRAMGIKGVKVDFFGGDGQSMLAYQRDILKDAAAAELLVNFHGTTLPRGLHRTYPNLLTAEAIRGMEYATFEQASEDRRPLHCVTAALVRNVFDPMDFTPVVLDQIPNIRRATTSGFELALPVVFTSGVTHFAETERGMTTVPESVRALLRGLPARWDETRFVDGHPSTHAVFARRAGNRWYVAGINGSDQAKALTLDLSFLPKNRSAKLVTDGEADRSFSERAETVGGTLTVNLKAHGGFVLVVD